MSNESQDERSFSPDRPLILKFPIADLIKVLDAERVKGMLCIFLDSFILEDKKTNKVPVKSL